MRLAADPRVGRELDILLVEDEPDIRDAIREVLSRSGHEVTCAADGEQAMRRLDVSEYDLAICDIRLPKVDGLTIFQRIKTENPDSHVILMSAYGSVAEAVEAMKNQATHYLAKPFSLRELGELVEEIASQQDLRRELAAAQAHLGSSPTPIVGLNAAMRRLRQRITAIAPSDAQVLVTGESGTGKELVARRIHEESARAGGPFVAVNCAAFPDTLLEAELFGHERGAFTGAHKKREGRFRAAHGGTLFLDEIADMALPAQAKLLRVLENGRYEPLGSDASVEIDIRIVSATNADLAARIEEGLFREDILHRLRVFHLHIPPLRERPDDLSVLVQHLYSRITGKDDLIRIRPRAWAALCNHSFPGNVRELKHIVEHAVVLARRREIDLHHLPYELSGVHTPLPPVEDALPLPEAMKEFEREYLLRALRECGWQRTRTAEQLGVSRKTLWQKLRQHGIDESEAEGPGSSR